MTGIGIVRATWILTGTVPTCWMENGTRMPILILTAWGCWQQTPCLKAPSRSPSLRTQSGASFPFRRRSLQPRFPTRCACAFCSCRRHPHCRWTCPLCQSRSPRWRRWLPWRQCAAAAWKTCPSPWRPLRQPQPSCCSWLPCGHGRLPPSLHRPCGWHAPSSSSCEASLHRRNQRAASCVSSSP